LHKRVLELTASQSTALYRRISGRPYVELVALMQRLTDALSRDLGRALEPCDVLIDAPPVHKEVEFRVDVFTAKTGRHQPLGEVSPVVAALARTQFDDSVKRVRVFATAEVAAILNPAVVERRLAEVA
jgi:hypothetical protein